MGDFSKPFIAAFWPILEQVISPLHLRIEETNADAGHPFYAVTFANDEVRLRCEVERGRPAVTLKRNNGEHWFQLSYALRALKETEFDPLDVQALARGLLESYRELVSSLDTEPFNGTYIGLYSARLGGHRPW